jgi:hypothetical protein
VNCPECFSSRCEESVIGEGFFVCSACGKLFHGGNAVEVSSVVDQEASRPGDDYDPDIPVYAEVSIGWRAWQVAQYDTWAPPKLKSVTHSGTYWMPRRVCEAVCEKQEAGRTSRRRGKWEAHTVPGETCSCGLYAASDLAHLKKLGYNAYHDIKPGHVKVIGSVSLWGKVIPGSQGWKAQFGYPKELFVPYEAWRLVEPLRELYGVPVTLSNIL